MNATLIAILLIFQVEAETNAPLPVVFEIVALDSTYGKATIFADHYTVYIDKEFVDYYGIDSPQVKRLVYHELGHLLLNAKDGEGIMDPKRVHKPMTKRELNQLFLCK